MNSDGSDKDKLFDENFADFYVLDNEIVGYYCEGEAFTDEFDACYFALWIKRKDDTADKHRPFQQLQPQACKGGRFYLFYVAV